MALTLTSCDHQETFVGGPVTSASISLAAGSVMLVGCIGFADVTAAPTATGLTFTLIDQGNDGTRGAYLWRALVGGGGFAGTVTMFSGSDTCILYDIVEVRGAVTTGTNASDAIVQHQGVVAAAVTPFDQNYTSTFSSANNGGYAIFCHDQGADVSPFSPRSGWTFDAGATRYALAEYRTTSDTAAGFTSTGPFSDFIGVMVEIAAAAPSAVIDDDPGPVIYGLMNPPKWPEPITTVFA